MRQRSPKARIWAQEQNQAGSVNRGRNDHSSDRNGWSLKDSIANYTITFSLRWMADSFQEGIALKSISLSPYARHCFFLVLFPVCNEYHQPGV